MNFNWELGCELPPSANKHTHTWHTMTYWENTRPKNRDDAISPENIPAGQTTFYQLHFENGSLYYQPIDVTSIWGRRNLTRNGRNGNTSVIEKPVENYENQKRPHYNVCSHSACTDMLHIHTPLTHPPVHSYSTHYQQPSDSINFDNLPSDAKPLQLGRNFGVTPWE